MATTYDATDDIQINWDVLNPGGDESMRGFINLSAMTYYSSGATQLIGQSSGPAQMLTPSPTTAYDASNDLLMRWDTTSGTLRAFIDSADITNYSTIGDRYLGKSDGSWSWLTGTTAGADTDELVKVTSDDTAAQYLSDAIRFADNSSGHYKPQYDLDIYGQVTNAGGKRDA